MKGIKGRKLKYLVIVILFLLTACGSNATVLPTKTVAMPTALAVPVQDDNFLLTLDEENFIPSLV
jgi:uncharacterized protein YcfL